MSPSSIVLFESNSFPRCQVRHQSTADALDGLPESSARPIECNTALMHIHTLTSAYDVIWGYASEWKAEGIPSATTDVRGAARTGSHQDVDIAGLVDGG
ncbi:hypothetical protein JTB14_038232 [Gonioctena quinquepunctata]|nr:hypothetical protein JTB14_038232 [Gonioctena quinquepunctata]